MACLGLGPCLKGLSIGGARFKPDHRTAGVIVKSLL